MLQKEGQAVAVGRDGGRFSQKDDGGEPCQCHICCTGKIAQEIIRCDRQKYGDGKEPGKRLAFRPLHIFFLHFFTEKRHYNWRAIVLCDEKCGNRADTYTNVIVNEANPWTKDDNPCEQSQSPGYDWKYNLNCLKDDEDHECHNAKFGQERFQSHLGSK